MNIIVNKIYTTIYIPNNPKKKTNKKFTQKKKQSSKDRGDMRDLDRAVEWLRPFVDSKSWDYCVVWKLGDDPSRFIEWLDCCCSGVAGGGYDCFKVKEESGEKQRLSSFCRDAHLKHTVRTKACEALAHFPFFMDLYSGIHGEAVILNQPKWISLASSSDSNPSHQSISTRVLIPVFGGLIELFAAKHIPKDQNIIELVIAHCNTSRDQRVVPAGSYANVSLDEQCLNLLLKEDLQNFPSPLQLLTLSPSTQALSAVTQFKTRPYDEGSSSGSNPPIEHPSFDSNHGCIAQNVPLKQLIGNSCGRQPRYKNHVFKEETRSVLDTNLNAAVKDNIGNRQRFGRAKNLVTERNRRNKIKDLLFALRSLVPKISKMDRAAILGDAVEYIKELLQEVDKLQNELKENEEEVFDKHNAEMESSNKIHEGTSTIRFPPTEHNKTSPGCGENRKTETEVQVEVSQIDKRDFLIKLLCEHRRGGFVRLMEAINSLELQVIDANVTTSNGKVLNILRVQANTENIRQKKLKETLIELAR